MTKLKMGIHNKITKERYAKIRGALAEGMSYKQILARYNIGMSTLRRIRRADTYYAYRLSTEKLPRAKKMPKNLSASTRKSG